jgi:hypothetical protein
MRSRIRLKKQFERDPKKYCKIRPIGPKSVIRVRGDNPGPYRGLIGHLLRVGYYSKQDGLNAIWIVYANGEYGETTTHSHLNRHFTIISDSGETGPYGDGRPILLPLSKEEIEHLSKIGIARCPGSDS